jgi:hypothetical protein
MEDLDPMIVHDLRKMAKKGLTPSQMLRAIVNKISPNVPHKLELIRYMREAFCLSLQQASPIAGWVADGSGELNDSGLDGFTMPEIAKNRRNWESLEAA